MALLNQSIMGEAARGDSQSHKKRKLDHRAMGEQTERLAASNGATCAADTGHGPSGDADPKQRVLKLLEPFSREQLLEILTTAATQHEDVLHAIKASASVDVAHRKIFVRGLAWETTTEGLTEAFEAFGQVEEAAVIYDKASGKSRGYGFVTFVEMDGAQRAIETQAIEIDGRRATCNLAAVRASSDDHHTHHQHYQHQQPHYGGAAASNQYSNHVAHGHQPTHAMGHAAPVRQGTHMAPPAAAAPYTVYTTTMPPPAAVYAVPAVAPPAIVMEPPRTQNDEADRKLFVRGLSWDTTDESLRGEFIKYGELSEASVVRERKTGKSKGFGFVTFRHRGAAAAALLQPHKVIDGRSVTCNLASLGRTTPHGGGSSASYMAPPPTAYAPPPQQQPDMGGYTMYAQPPAAVDPYHQHPQYAYGGAPPPLPPTQQYYYPPAPQSHPGQQSRR